MKERLKKYILLKKENENHLERLIRMKSKAKYKELKQNEGMKANCSGESMAKIIESYIEYELQIVKTIEANRKEMKEIEAIVNRLQDPLQREILRLRYLDSNNSKLQSWSNIAWIIYQDNSLGAVKACQRIHNKALKKIKKMVFVPSCP